MVSYELVLHFGPGRVVSEKLAVETQPSTDAELNNIINVIQRTVKNKELYAW